MALSDAPKRVERWTRRVKDSPEVLSTVTTRLVDGMLTRFTATTDQLVEMEDMARGFLNGEGVATILYPFYFAFARELHKLQRRGIAGDSLAAECRILEAKWTSRGLTLLVLQDLAFTVFDIPKPAGP